MSQQLAVWTLPLRFCVGTQCNSSDCHLAGDRIGNCLHNLHRDALVGYVRRTNLNFCICAFIHVYLIWFYEWMTYFDWMNMITSIIYNVGAYRPQQPGFTIHWQIYDPNKLQHYQEFVILAKLSTLVKGFQVLINHRGPTPNSWNRCTHSCLEFVWFLPSHAIVTSQLWNWFEGPKTKAPILPN